MSIDSLAAVVSDNDGAAFITKAEFDSLKNDFQGQINQFNTNIDQKITGAITSYIEGIKESKTTRTKPLFAAAYNGKIIKSVNSNDSMFFSKGENMWNLNFFLIESWDYVRKDSSAAENSTVDKANMALKCWSYKLTSSAVTDSQKAKRTFVSKTSDNKWRLYGLTKNYYETHNYFGAEHSFMTDYGFNDTGYFLVPWRFNVGATTVLDISGNQTGGWRTNMQASGDKTFKNSVVTPKVASWGTSKTYTLEDNSDSLLIFNNTTSQFVFDKDNVTKLIGNSNLVSNNCYNWYLSSRISATGMLSYTKGCSGEKNTAVGQKSAVIVPHEPIAKSTVALMTSVGINDTQMGKSHYPPVLAPIDINKTSFTSILASDTNKYTYTVGGTEHEIKDYSVCDGFPFYATTADQSSFKWTVYNAGSSGRVYFKIGPFGSGASTSSCIYSKTISAGSNTIEFSTSLKNMIWVKWDIGVSIDVDKSSGLVITTI